MRAHLSELGVGPIATERCLNHSLDGLMAIYEQRDLVDEQRDALERWADKLIALEAGVDAAHIATQRAPSLHRAFGHSAAPYLNESPAPDGRRGAARPRP